LAAFGGAMRFPQENKQDVKGRQLAAFGGLRPPRGVFALDPTVTDHHDPAPGGNGGMHDG
jgi:hypothetical protein